SRIITLLRLPHEPEKCRPCLCGLPLEAGLRLSRGLTVRGTSDDDLARGPHQRRPPGPARGPRESSRARRDADHQPGAGESVERAGAAGQRGKSGSIDAFDAAIQTTSTSKVRRVDFALVGGHRGPVELPSRLLDRPTPDRRDATSTRSPETSRRCVCFTPPCPSSRLLGERAERGTRRFTYRTTERARRRSQSSTRPPVRTAATMTWPASTGR